MAQALLGYWQDSQSIASRINNGSISREFKALSEVPQGSYLGPQLFILIHE